MKTNIIRAKMDAGEKAYGCTIMFPSSTLVELVGIAGFDFISFDCHQGTFNMETIADLVRVAETSGLTAVVRLPDIERATVKSFLDLGIMALQAPDVRTANEARQFVDVARFPPIGDRSMGRYPPSRSWTKGGSAGLDLMRNTNEQITLGFQLEHVKVLDELDEIIAVEGIDFYMSGPADIAASMGLGGRAQSGHPKVKEFQKRVEDAVRAAGKKMYQEVAAVAHAEALFEGAVRAALRELKTG